MQKIIEKWFQLKLIKGAPEILKAEIHYPDIHFCKKIGVCITWGTVNVFELLFDPKLAFLKTLIGDEMVCSRCGSSISEYRELNYEVVDGRIADDWLERLKAHKHYSCIDHKDIPKSLYIALEAVKIMMDESLSDEERLNKAINLIQENMK